MIPRPAFSRHKRELTKPDNDLYLLPGNRIPRALHVQQLYRLAVRRGQTPLQGLEKLAALPADAHEFRLGRGLVAFDPEGDVDRALQRTQLAADPGHFAGEVDLVPQDVAGVRVRAQRVQDAVDGRAR